MAKRAPVVRAERVKPAVKAAARALCTKEGGDPDEIVLCSPAIRQWQSFVPDAKYLLAVAERAAFMGLKMSGRSHSVIG